MAAKKKQARRRADAVQVFRQFAWHLAGSLAESRSAPTAPGKRRPTPAATGKR